MPRFPAFGLLLLVCAGAVAQPLPAGWRLPQDKDLTDEARSESATRLASTVGDFNGDGVEDRALLLKSKTKSAEALWVWLSNQHGGHQWIRLDEITWPKEYSDVPLAMGVETKPPGELVYACFDADKVCNFDAYERRPKMTLRYDAILYFKLESAASAYYWSGNRKKFVRVWLSD